MSELARRHAWPEPEPEPDGDGYSLVVDLDLELRLFQVDKALFFEGSVATLPSPGPAREELLRRLMRLHLARFHNHEEVLTVSSAEPDDDPAKDGILTLYRRIDAFGLSASKLEEALGAFVGALEFWARTAATATPVAPAPPPGMRMLFP